MKYRTETQSGLTNSAGQFKYQAGETITFMIGQLELFSYNVDEVLGDGSINLLIESGFNPPVTNNDVKRFTGFCSSESELAFLSDLIPSFRYELPSKEGSTARIHGYPYNYQVFPYSKMSCASGGPWAEYVRFWDFAESIWLLYELALIENGVSVIQGSVHSAFDRKFYYNQVTGRAAVPQIQESLLEYTGQGGKINNDFDFALDWIYSEYSLNPSFTRVKSEASFLDRVKIEDSVFSYSESAAHRGRLVERMTFSNTIDPRTGLAEDPYPRKKIENYSEPGILTELYFNAPEALNEVYEVSSVVKRGYQFDRVGRLSRYINFSSLVSNGDLETIEYDGSSNEYRYINGGRETHSYNATMNSDGSIILKDPRSEGYDGVDVFGRSDYSEWYWYEQGALVFAGSKSVSFDDNALTIDDGTTVKKYDGLNDYRLMSVDGQDLIYDDEGRVLLNSSRNTSYSFYPDGKFKSILIGDESSYQKSQITYDGDNMYAVLESSLGDSIASLEEIDVIKKPRGYEVVICSTVVSDGSKALDTPYDILRVISYQKTVRGATAEMVVSVADVNSQCSQNLSELITTTSTLIEEPSGWTGLELPKSYNDIAIPAPRNYYPLYK